MLNRLRPRMLTTTMATIRAINTPPTIARPWATEKSARPGRLRGGTGGRPSSVIGRVPDEAGKKSPGPGSAGVPLDQFLRLLDQRGAVDALAGHLVDPALLHGHLHEPTEPGHLGGRP